MMASNQLASEVGETEPPPYSSSFAAETVQPQPEVAAEAEEEEEEMIVSGAGEVVRETKILLATPSPLLNKKLLLCRRFKDSGGSLRNFNSLPLFVYATSPSTRATSADGVGVSKEAAAAAAVISVGKNDSYDVVGIMDCLPLGVSGSGGGAHHHAMAAAAAGTTASSATSTGGGGGVVSYQHHLNLVNHHLNPLSHPHHHHLLGSGVSGGHHSPYSNNYPLHHSSSHHHIHSEQTKSLQELQHEVGALLEFRDLVIETFPDLKHKMASMSSSTTSSAAAVGGGGSSVNAPVSGTNTLTGGMSNSSLASRREWEPGIRIKRKISQKEPSTSTSSPTAAAGVGAVAGGELSSTSLTRSRSNSHSGKKEPKSGENNNGSVVQDSGFSTETSSSKEGHSASSTNGAMTATIAANRLACPESDDELLNLLDVIHRKSNRLREEVEHLQNYERQNLRDGVEPPATEESVNNGEGGGGATTALTQSSTSGTTASSSSCTQSVLTPKTFREHVERLNKEDIKQLRRERDRLLDKLAEMEAETLTGRIKAAKMSDQVEELISVKKDLEEQLKLAMAQKLELSSRVQQLQQQQPLQSKSSSSQSDYSSQRNFLSSAATVLSTGSGGGGASSSQTAESGATNASVGTVPAQTPRRPNTFQPVVIEQQQLPSPHTPPRPEDIHVAFHQSAGGSDSGKQQQLGRLDGIVSTPSARNAKCRVTDSKRFTAILLETSVIELQRHLLTLTVQNQGLMQKLEQSAKSKTHLAKRLDKSKEDVEDLRFQLEEKSIELEGTKAQLRVLESRFHSSTLSSGAATNSYLHSSQHDYETNRSSASTTLMLSRRGGIESNCSDLRSRTPQSHVAALAFSSSASVSSSVASTHMPQPQATQISTPSMKAMTHLAMDELQHHSSSTESAHEHELLQQELRRPQTAGAGGGGGAAGIIGRLMSTSVGGVSPFAEQLSPRNAGQQPQALKKFAVLGGTTASSKPSKIPLPGSKAAAYFAGKPPTGRSTSSAVTAGRSPPSANTSHGSTTSGGSSKSSLSRSTGNLLYSKSPNSLKRADSAQSIRKDAANCTSNSSTFSNTSGRSSNTSSSIPLATTPYGGGSGFKSPSSSQNTPSARVLQNSPLPKLKRESLTSRVRHLDSLSRVHQHNHAETPSVALTSSGSAGGGSYVVSSTPKPSSIAAQLNSTLRKDLQLSASVGGGSQPSQFPRRTVSPAAATATRRFSSSTNAGSVSGLRVASGGVVGSPRHSQQEQRSNVAVGAESGGGGGVASDSDSGKKNLWCFYDKPQWHQTIKSAPDCQAITTSASDRKPLINNYKQNGDGGLPHLMSAFTEKPMLTISEYQNPYFRHYHHHHSNLNDHEAANYLLEQLNEEVEDGLEVVEEDDCSFTSNERGSDNLLVTFDYGFSDSIDEQIPDSWRAEEDCDEQDVDDSCARGIAFAIGAESGESLSPDAKSSAFDNANDTEFNANDAHDAQIWFYAPYTKRDDVDGEAEADVAATFQVHRMQHPLHQLKEGGSAMSLISAYTEYNVDESETEENNDADADKEVMNFEAEQFYDSIEGA